MFDTYRLGYFVLIVLSILGSTIGFSLGQAPILTVNAMRSFIVDTLPLWALIPLVWAGFLAVELTRRHVDRPLSAMRSMLYGQRRWLGRGMLFVLIVFFVARSVSSLKTAIPMYVPYYADPWLMQLDRAIFGTDAWRLTHAVIGPAGTVFIDRVYASWFGIMMLYIGWFCFSRNQELQLRGLLTYLLSWYGFGAVVSYSLASVGPCYVEFFYRDPHFSPLMADLRAIDRQHPLIALKAMNFLVEDYGRDRFGAGISAMPSMHVAVAFLCFLVAWTYGRHRWAKLAGFLFFATILVGSVHLGWHYAVDGIASVLAVGAIWWGTGRFVRWVKAREAALGQAGTAAPFAAAAAA